MISVATILRKFSAQPRELRLDSQTVREVFLSRKHVLDQGGLSGRLVEGLRKAHGSHVPALLVSHISVTKDLNHRTNLKEISKLLACLSQMTSFHILVASWLQATGGYCWLRCSRRRPNGPHDLRPWPPCGSFASCDPYSHSILEVRCPSPSSSVSIYLHLCRKKNLSIVTCINTRCAPLSFSYSSDSASLYISSCLPSKKPRVSYHTVLDTHRASFPHFSYARNARSHNISRNSTRFALIRRNRYDPALIAPRSSYINIITLSQPPPRTYHLKHGHPNPHYVHQQQILYLLPQILRLLHPRNLDPSRPRRRHLEETYA